MKRCLSGKRSYHLHETVLICVFLQKGKDAFLFREKGEERKMENRVALLAVIVENTDSTEALNAILHDYSSYIIGRMGIPYRQREISLISVAVDAPSETVNALCGRLGKLDGVTAKAVYAKLA